MENAIDKIETLILLALDANHSQLKSTGRSIKANKKNDGMARIEYDVGSFLKFGEMYPDSSYTFDVSGDRLIGTKPEHLVYHPSEILGDKNEVMMIDDTGTLKWIGFRKTRKPNGVFSSEKACVWYELHFRKVFHNSVGAYVKRLVPIALSGKPLTAYFQNAVIGNTQNDGFSTIAACSIIEDAHRSNTMLASVRDAKEIKFPVSIGDYKDVFAERDGPMNGARRKAILHWVARHLRHSTRGKEFAVKKHTRGVQEFTIDGLRIRLTPNAKG